MANVTYETFDKEIIKYISYLLQNNNNNLNLILCQPNFEKLGCLGITSDENITLNFNDKTPLSFKYYKYIFDYNIGDYSKQLLYDEIERHRLIRFAGVGWFYIEEVEEYSDGVEKYKTVTCYSYEHLLTHRSVNLWSDLQSDDNSMTVTLEQILLELQKQTGWKIPENVSDKTQPYFKVQKTINIDLNTSWYNFLIETVQKEFDVIFFFNYRDLKIDVKYSFANDYLRESNLILSFSNIMKDITITESSQKCATALYVTGDTGVGISNVNPLGTNIIYNFDYYKNTKWMSQGLIDALNKWEEKIAKYQKQYKYVCGFRNYLLELQTEYETKLKELEAEVQKYSDVLSANKKDGSGYLDSKNGWNYKTAVNRKNLVQDNLEILNKALQIFYEESVSTSIGNDFVMKMGGLYADTIPINRIFMNSGLNSVEYPRQYMYSHTFDDTNGFVDKEYHYNRYWSYGGSWLQINKNYYGQKLRDLHNSGEKVYSLADFQKGFSWKTNFTTEQLKELSKFIIDASYSNTDIAYLDYDSYFNYIDYYDVQLGRPQASSSKSVSNPNDPFTYGVGYWTTNFIQLPNNDRLENEYKNFLYFYNRETGEKIKPSTVTLYPTKENVSSILRYPNGANGLQQTKYEGVEYKYCRASFVYNPNDLTNTVPIRMVSAIIGDKYDNNTKCNIDTEQELYTTVKRIHKELIDPCKSFSVNLANFLSLKEFADFANDIQLGDKVLAEIEPNEFISVRFLSMQIDFQNIENLSLEFANKYNKYSDVLMFRKLIGSVSDTFDIQNSFNSFDLNDKTPILPEVGNPEYIPNTSGIIGDVDIPSTTDDNVIEIENEFEIIQDVDNSNIIEIKNEFEITTGEKIEMEV